MKVRRQRALLMGCMVGMCLWASTPVFAQSMIDKILGLVGGASVSGQQDFDLPSTDGERVLLSEFRGKKPVLLYFWAIWCPSCQAVKPELVKLRQKMPEDQLEILGINVGTGDSFERVKKYQKAHPMPFKVLYDAEGAVTRAFDVRGIPLFVVVDKTGSIVYRDHQLPSDIRRLIQ
ncbi:peroxiredoxin family protein [Desulfosoma caldarium]|uniref:Peroxiredoxin n=1 Tax=Desulfosoma caldarium TaxID=610254 RepID=A0A3N1UX58_9BACT|nr:TlpA disulfide reductase family protein [Desulfosoma caldarium]ROQ93270.1 peroxiredoxin [Desulfosoma caldarium]